MLGLYVLETRRTTRVYVANRNYLLPIVVQRFVRLHGPADPV